MSSSRKQSEQAYPVPGVMEFLKSRVQNAVSITCFVEDQTARQAVYLLVKSRGVLQHSLRFPLPEYSRWTTEELPRAHGSQAWDQSHLCSNAHFRRASSARRQCACHLQQPYAHLPSLRYGIPKRRLTRSSKGEESAWLDSTIGLSSIASGNKKSRLDGVSVGAHPRPAPSSDGALDDDPDLPSAQKSQAL